MRKEIKWVFEGKEFTGCATLEDGVLALRDEKGEAFEILEESETEFDLEELFDDIPEDVTDYKLA